MSTLAEEKLYADIAGLYNESPETMDEIAAEFDPVAWVRYVGMDTEKGEPIEFARHKPLMAVYRDLHPHQVFRKGAQIGMTQTSINKVLWYGKYHKVTFIYTMPTAKDVYEFSQSRFGPIIKGNQWMRTHVGNVDNATLKSIGNSWVHFRGAQKESQAISVPADILVTDEYDFSSQDILDTFRKRTIASDLKWEWNFSTPTIPEYGIDALYRQTDQRHWLVKCTRCNRWQKVSYWKNIFKSHRKGFYFGCWKCKKVLKRLQGEWVAAFPDRAVDTEYDENGKVVNPAYGMRGYFVNPLTFTFITADEKVKNYNTARKSTRPSAIKNFHNFELGEPYVSGESLITQTKLLETMNSDYEETGYNVFGCDQGDVFHWIVKHVGRNGRKPTVAFGKTSDPNRIAQIFAEYHCRLGIIDALPNKHTARGIVQIIGNKRMFMAYYKDQGPASREQIENKRDPNKLYTLSKRETQTVLLDRTEVLDSSAKEWIEGRAYLIGEKDSVKEEMQDFIRQMCAMKRDLQEDTKGIIKAVWVKIADDHYRHADSYANVAISLRSAGGMAGTLTVGGSIAGVGLPSDFDTRMFGGMDFSPTPVGGIDLLLPRHSR